MATILIVDDSDICREVAKKILEDGGHTVIGEACNGEECVEKFKELRPDVTMLDITMPVLDGIEALKQIKELDPDANVIMASSSAQNSKIVEALMLGASDFLAKPINPQKLMDCISDIVDLYES